MDIYTYFWGVIKFVVPLILFSVSLVPPVKYLLMIVAILWAFSAIAMTVFNMQEPGKRERPL